MRKFYILSAVLALFFTGCATQELKLYDYSSFLQRQPRSILVVMPTNDSVEPKGSYAMLANAILPLCEAGYYVFPVTLVNDTFRANGIFEANDIVNIPTKKLKEIFGADAALYINVQRYGTSYALLSSNTEIGAVAKLVDLDTATTLWEKAVYINSDSGSSGSIIASLISAAINQIISTISDEGYNLSSTASSILFAPNCRDCILQGYRSPHFGKDIQLNK